MKKVLYISGFGLLFGSLYYYFKHQLKLALQYEYDIERWKILTWNTKEIQAEVVVKLLNKSAFSVEVLDYSFNLLYKNIEITTIDSTDSFIIKSNNSVEIPAIVNASLSNAAKGLLPFFTEIIQQKPIKVIVSGYVNVKFMGISQRINFDADEYQYSNNILEDVGLKDNWENLQKKFKFLKKV